MSKPPFFVTHSADEGARRDGRSNIEDTINNFPIRLFQEERHMQNIEFDSKGQLRPRKGWTTFSGMIWQLWLINKRFTKQGVVGEFTVRLPLKPGRFKP